MADNCLTRSDTMNNKEERVTVRFGDPELSEIDVLVEELGFKNRSEFIRRAVTDYTRRKRVLHTDSEEVLVHISSDQISVIDNLVAKKQHISRETPLFEIIRDYINRVPWDRVDSTTEKIQASKFENAKADLDREMTRRYMEH